MFVVNSFFRRVFFYFVYFAQVLRNPLFFYCTFILVNLIQNHIIIISDNRYCITNPESLPFSSNMARSHSISNQEGEWVQTIRCCHFYKSVGFLPRIFGQRWHPRRQSFIYMNISGSTLIAVAKVQTCLHPTE